MVANRTAGRRWFTGMSGFLLNGVILIGLYHIKHILTINDSNLLNFVEAVYAITFTILILSLSIGLGAKAIRWMQIHFESSGLRLIYAATMGMGILSLAIFFAGLAGWINKGSFLLLALVTAFVGASEMVEVNKLLSGALRHSISNLNSQSFTTKLLLIICLFILTFSFLQALTPPFDYDGLAYHLQNPRIFLEAGKISPMPDNWLTYYPQLYEMLYLAGLVFQTDIAAKLLHFAAFILFLAAVYCLGKFLFSKEAGAIAAVILIGIPILPIWSTTTYVDIAWALYQFLAVGVTLIWIKERQPKWLLLAGIFQGFTLGCKYLGFAGAGVLGVLILWFSWQAATKGEKFNKPLIHGTVFGSAALLVASPWYIKNFLWTGDPLFPLLLPSSIVDTERIKLWVDYMQSFGIHNNLLDYFVLPVNLFIHHEAFGTYLGAVDIPHPLFLLFPAYLWTRKKLPSSHRQLTDVLIAIIGVLFIVWAFNSEQTRFLLPVYPLLAVFIGDLVVSLKTVDQIKRITSVFSMAFLGSMAILTLLIVLAAFLTLSPHKQLTGVESRSQFLGRMVNSYNAHQFINQNLNENDRVFMVWDARGYYCEKSCIADIDQMGWVVLYKNNPSIKEMSSTIKQQKITHILYSKSDADFFTIAHDTHDVHSKAKEFLLGTFIKNCGIPIYNDDNEILYELHPEYITCQ